MNEGLARTLVHLRALVACDTRNPPRAIDASHPIVGTIRTPLAACGFSVEVVDLGKGSVNVFATRGKADLLFNFHVDTVPDAANWTGSPFELRISESEREGARAIGLGACDIKGAAAAMIAAAEHAEGPAALLFSTDEEAGNDECVHAFVAQRAEAFRGVVVAEPTSNKATLAHRGTVSCEAKFSGVSGHGSNPSALHESALHRFVRWGGRALALAESLETEEVGGLSGVRFNLGIASGGTKANMIADHASCRFGLRPRPGEEPDALVGAFSALDDTGATFARGFRGSPLPPAGRTPATALAERLALPLGPAVDFWTEAPLFAEAGLSSLVYGPGSIAQAHTRDEWVLLSQLEEAYATYERILRLQP
ncbi:MAG: acetylornithine deacetylase [Polyangiaceae bacterium]